MKFTVTQEHISRGLPCRARRCPVALALGWWPDPSIGLGGVSSYHIDSPDGLTSYRTTMDVRKFIADFDNGKPVQPFTFEL